MVAHIRAENGECEAVHEQDKSIKIYTPHLRRDPKQAFGGKKVIGFTDARLNVKQLVLSSRWPKMVSRPSAPFFRCLFASTL